MGILKYLPSAIYFRGGQRVFIEDLWVFMGTLGIVGIMGTLGTVLITQYTHFTHYTQSSNN